MGNWETRIDWDGTLGTRNSWELGKPKNTHWELGKDPPQQIPLHPAEFRTHARSAV